MKKIYEIPLMSITSLNEIEVLGASTDVYGDDFYSALNVFMSE